MSVEILDAPLAVRTIDLGAEPVDAMLGAASGGRPYNGIYAIATRDGLARGAVCVPATGGVVTADVLRQAIAPFGEDGSPAATAGRASAGEATPLVSVVICAIDGGASAVRTVETVLAGSYEPVEVIVVNNRPSAGRLDPVEEAFADDPRVITADEPRPGLSFARNAGIAAATGEIVAFTDDDAVPDGRWIERVVTAFAEVPDAACVTGLIVPLALETDAQVLLERYAGYSKGFERRRWSMRENGGEHLFPYRAGQFGSGANVALRADALKRLDGYDDALGIGTPANGGEDLDLFIRVLMNGMVLVYEPSAMVWHEHPPTIEHIEREVALYGSGLTAAMFKQLVHGPRRRRLIGSLGGAVRYALSPSSEKNERKGDGFPRSYTLAELRGMLYGPIGYLRSRRYVRRSRASGAVRRSLIASLLVFAGLLGGGEFAEPTRAETGEARGGRVSEREEHPNGPPREPLPVESFPGPLRFEPVWVGETDVSETISGIIADRRPDGGEYATASLLVRVGGEPAGFARLNLAGGRATPDELEAAIGEQLGSRVDALRRAADRATDPPAPVEQPAASVVICSRDRPESLERALRSVLALDYPAFEVIVVDNAPGTPGTRRAVDVFGSGTIRYVAEPEPGLSRARNRGLSVARGEIIAFTDDDVVVDRGWLGSLAKAFAQSPNVGCVTGLVPTAELRTEQQQIFDDMVNWSSALKRRVVSLDDGDAEDPLFPYRTGRLGTGANFAVGRNAAVAVGPFDEALGAGSPAGGGEDLDYFLRVLESGWSIAVEPAAIVWHYHRADAAALKRQFYAYGAGAFAYGAKHGLRPRNVARIARQSAAGVAHAGRDRAGGQLGDADAANAAPSRARLPGSELTRAKWRGRLAGPALYLKGRAGTRGRRPLVALPAVKPEDSSETAAGPNMSMFPPISRLEE